MRLLLDADDPTARAVDEVPLGRLAELYAYPEAGRWVRANMVSTLDGAATGEDGRSGSINDAADKVVFDLLRALADVVVVGAGTARAEGYGPVRVPEGLAHLRGGRTPAPALVLVSRTGRLPARLTDAARGEVLLVVSGAAGREAIGEAREALGDDAVLVAGEDDVDLSVALTALEERGLRRGLCEGGPHLLADLVAAGLLDELCLTMVPTTVGGGHPRILADQAARGRFAPRLLLEQDGTLLGRWVRG